MESRLIASAAERTTRQSHGPTVPDALSFVLPNPTDTLLLRACLHSADGSRRAWREWRDKVGDPKATFENDKRGLKGLLPLAESSIRHNDVEIVGAFRTYLRVSHVREELRGKIIREIFQRTAAALRAAGIAPITLRGFALAETAYEEPAMRHCHAMDFLVADDELDAAAAAVGGAGFAPDKILAQGPRHRHFRHRTNLLLVLHCRLFPAPHYRPSLARLRARSQALRIAGEPARVLSPADNLLHVCGYAACVPTRDNLRWVCDAWNIMRVWPALDWENLLAVAREGRLALPLATTLNYLAEELDAPVPQAVRAELSRMAATADREDTEAGVLSAISGLRSARAALFGQTISWRVRARILGFLLLPSPRYLRGAQPIPHGAMLPWLYLYRPAKYVVSRIYRRLADRAAGHED